MKENQIELEKKFDELFKLCQEKELPIPKNAKIQGKWNGTLNNEDKKCMSQFIKFLYIGVKMFSVNKYANHVLYIAVREITRIIGQFTFENFQISKKAEEKLGKGQCKDIKSAEKAREKIKGVTIMEHKKPAVVFFNELKDAEPCLEKVNSKGKEKFIYRKNPFTKEQSEGWLKEAVIAIISKDEDKALRNKGWWKVRPKNAYDLLLPKIELHNIRKH